MKRVQTMLAGLAVSLSTAVVPAHGIMLFPILETDFSGNEEVVTFDVAMDTPLPFAASGANFLGHSGDSATVIAALGELVLEDSGLLTITFDNPIRRFGFRLVLNDFFVTFIIAEVFQGTDGSGSQGQIVFGDGNFGSAVGFQGFQSDTSFSRTEIQFQVSLATLYSLDDVRFENGVTAAPAPGSVSLMLVGLGGGLLLLPWRRFNRKRAIGLT